MFLLSILLALNVGSLICAILKTINIIKKNPDSIAIHILELYAFTVSATMLLILTVQVMAVNVGWLRTDQLVEFWVI
jgi:hypothetical protein